MAQLRNRTTGLVRSSQQVDREIRARVSCGAVINYADYDEDVIFPAPAPAYDPITQYAREIAPKLINGHYEQDYEVAALDAETIAANQVAAHKTSITNQITALEATITNRRIREAIRGSGKQWLDNIDDQITALRVQL